MIRLKKIITEAEDPRDGQVRRAIHNVAESAEKEIRFIMAASRDRNLSGGKDPMDKNTRMKMKAKADYIKRMADYIQKHLAQYEKFARD